MLERNINFIQFSLKSVGKIFKKSKGNIVIKSKRGPPRVAFGFTNMKRNNTSSDTRKYGSLKIVFYFKR